MPVIPAPRITRVIAVLGLALSAVSWSVPARASSDTVPELDGPAAAYVADYVGRHGLPGASYAVLKDGDTVALGGAGGLSADTPMAVAINEVTNRVYVVNYGSSDVTVIDGVTNRPIATVAVGLWPQQIAVNATTNRIYVVNTHADTVSVIDGRTNAVVATPPTGRGPWAVAVDAVANIVYVANRLGDTVTIIDGRTHRAVQR